MGRHRYLLVAMAIALAIAADIELNDGRMSMYLAHDLLALQDYVQFWR